MHEGNTVEAAICLKAHFIGTHPNLTARALLCSHGCVMCTFDIDLKQRKDHIFPLAVCIVMSGMFKDDLDKSEEVICTGQGGHDLLGNKHQIKDQKLEHGNLALKNNSITGAPVRVVCGHESKSSYCGKVYTYDGLYKGNTLRLYLTCIRNTLEAAMCLKV